MSALIPTPMNPEIAGCTVSWRSSRHARISVATTRAAPMAGNSPNADETGTKTTTGSDE